MAKWVKIIGPNSMSPYKSLRDTDSLKLKRWKKTFQASGSNNNKSKCCYTYTRQKQTVN